MGKYTLKQKTMKNKLNTPSDFKVNNFLTIKEFVMQDEFVHLMKYGEFYKYQRFVGKIDDDEITGLLCLKDNNIYKLEKIEPKP